MEYIPEIDDDPPVTGRFFTCERHGWDSAGTACPKCKAGNAPRNCAKHGWSHSSKGCPKCAAGV